MRKFLIANILLGELLALPMFALSGDERTKLLEHLARTERALADLTLFEQRLVARDPSTVSELLATAEAGPADSVQAETELMSLRARVGALQEILDARSTESAPAVAPNKVVESTPQVPQVHAAPATVANTHPAEVAAPAANPTVPNKVAFEADGFVADRSRLGRACWRGARYLEGVAALEPLAGQPQADYWRARCLEKLSRNPEALELYRKVIEVSGQSPEGRSAREDLEFLEWSMAHGLVKTP